MGVVAPVPLRTYPGGFPAEIVAALRDAWGRGVICNRPYRGHRRCSTSSATEHLATGDLIVYTSADSVLQIAAHERRGPAGRAVRGGRVRRGRSCTASMRSGA